MRNLTLPVLVLSFLVLVPMSAAAQDAPAASPAAPLVSSTPEVNSTPEVDTTPDQGPAATPPPVAPDLGLYVGVGLGSNLNLGGGSFGYQLEASVGIFYRMFAAEILGGSTTINGNQIDSVGPHLGGALRVHLLQNERVGLQLGAGARYHAGRSQNGVDDRYTGGFASLRLLLPVTSNIAVRIDSEIEHVFNGPMSGAASNRLMLGFGIETRVSP